MNAFRRALSIALVALAFESSLSVAAFGIDLGLNLPFIFGGGLGSPYNAPPLPPDFGARSNRRESEPTFAARENDDASFDARPSVEIELSPMFSDRLPYSVALGRVVCESNFPLDAVDGLQGEVTQLQHDLVGYLGVPEAREKIELCLFKDVESYRDFIKANFQGAPIDRPALYVKADGPGVLMVPNNERMILNIRHEMTHAYLNASLRNVPIWIDEGLAKYFEIPPGERGFRNPYLKDAEHTVSGLFGAPPSLSRLEKLTRVDQMRSREYRESWSWIHFLIHYSPDTHRVLAYYLNSLRPEAQEGISASQAEKLQKKTPLKKALEKFVPDYEKKFVEHFKKWDEGQDAYERGRVESETSR